jgi:hypothetical protein
MRNIPLPRRVLLRAGLLTLLAFGGLSHDARSRDTPSPQSPKPATEPKLILEVQWHYFAVWYGQYGGGPEPTVLLRVFSDGTAEMPARQSDKTTKKTTLTQEQFDKVRYFLDQPDLLALKDPSCGIGGRDYVSTTTMFLYHRDQKQIVGFNNFYPRNGYYPHWPEYCPKIVVKLQCTVEELLAEPDSKVSHWKEDCQDILAK